MIDMNAIHDFDRTVTSTGTHRDAGAAGRHLGLPTDDLRVITSSLDGREAAISAGHRALAKLVTTRQVAADR
jgi:hypothetical protein